MAKNNNLTDFLTGIANAIRAKKGTSGAINPQNFEDEIETIVSGDAPQLNPPTISLSGDTLTVTNPATNGNFFSKFKLFAEGVKKADFTETVLNLKTYLTAEGTYNIAVKCAGAKFKDSELSSAVSWVFETLVLSYYGTATSLSYGFDYFGATTVGNYALFCTSSSTNAYDSSLTRTTPTALSVDRIGPVATTVGNYALFGGGYNSGSKDTVDAYDSSLTRTIPTALSVARQYLAATTVGNYALFGGGSSPENSGAAYYCSVVDAYDSSLTRSIPTALSRARHNLAATTVGNIYALFGGGFTFSDETSVVEVYDDSLTKTSTTALSKARQRLSATTVGNYALFGGGGVTVDVYTIS